MAVCTVICTIESNGFNSGYNCLSRIWFSILPDASSFHLEVNSIVEWDHHDNYSFLIWFLVCYQEM